MTSTPQTLFDYAAARPAERDPIDDVPADVRRLFETMALEVHKAGLKRYSARAIMHRIRWHHHIERGDAEFKINNKHSAPLARWFLKNHPELPDFFETREHADD